MNKVILRGNTGQTPDVKFTPSGKRVMRFSFATNRGWKNENEERVEVTDWHNIETWNPGIIDVLLKYGFKGQGMLIEGRLETQSYDDNGVKKYFTKVVANTIEILTWQGGAPGLSEFLTDVAGCDV